MDVLASSTVLTEQTGRDLQKTILEKFSENSASWALAQSLTNRGEAHFCKPDILASSRDLITQRFLRIHCL